MSIRYVIIGNGVAGITAAEQIRALDQEGEITLITDEPYPFYNRMRLIEYLTGKIIDMDLFMKPDGWYEENRITLLTDISVNDGDTSAQTLSLSDGSSLGYDRLLIATGGSSSSLPIPGASLEGVFTLRTIDDAKKILAYADGGSKRIVLIGGGVLGLEAGNSLRKAGHSISVIEFFPRLLPRQMDIAGASILQEQLETMGFTFTLGAITQEITGAGRAQKAILKDGRVIECDMVIISAGVRSNIELPQKLGLQCKKGLVVNDRLETDPPEIFGAGDVIQHRDILYGIWSAAEEQGRIAGTNMAGGDTLYEGSTLSNVLKVAGVSLFSAGNIDPDGNFRSIVSSSKEDFIYKKLVMDRDTVIGAILYGDLKDMVKILKAIGEGSDVSTLDEVIEKWDIPAS